jgi:hypothetical protein
MVKRNDAAQVDIAPDVRKLTSIQASRLAALANVGAKTLEGRTVAEISDKLRWVVDSRLLLFRRVCGRVVKRDPVTGIEYPVPFATVHVEDTDCHFVGFFPPGKRWSWFFPFHCHREEIGTVTTDECGRFCVWIPRFDIDWILRWRHERICFPDIFIRPTLEDILDELVAVPPFRRPIPEPDPAPFERDLADPLPRLRAFQRLARENVVATVGSEAARAIASLGDGLAFGASLSSATKALGAPAFRTPVPPPLPEEFRNIRIDHASTKGAKSNGVSLEAVRGTLASKLNVQPDALRALDLRKFIGPFRRCIDIFVPEWTVFFDVPDITFRVTQDVNHDGVEETIYSEGYFDVRWNAGAIPDVTLEASPIALAGRTCNVPPVPCGNTPAILSAGLLPLLNLPLPAAPYVDATAGYAKRPNRPHPSGDLVDPLPNPEASAPFCYTLQLYGCHRTDPAATHYRLRYSYSPDGVTFSGLSPFVGMTWPIHRLVGGTLEELWTASDADGWYPIQPNLTAPDTWLYESDKLLLEWPTSAWPDGAYRVRLELGTGGSNVTSHAPDIAFRIDNSAPQYAFTVEYRKVHGPPGFTPVTDQCQPIRRGATPDDLEFRVTLDVSATHFRSAFLTAGACVGGSFTPQPGGVDAHWHTSAGDNSVVLQKHYVLPASALAGTYSFGFVAASRAFNPSGYDSGHLLDWEYDPAPIYVNPSLSFSVIDAN